jgi:glycosyltransferase involved in cell wall biosynthesis
MWGISHFEAPLFRLLKQQPNIESRVYYLLAPERNKKFDHDYCQGIDWGEDILDGYDSEKCSTIHDMLYKVRGWKPDAVMIYGYLWPGALRLAVEYRLRGIPLLFRGTLNTFLDPRRSRLRQLTRLFRPFVFHLFRAHHFGGTYSQEVLRRAWIPGRRMFFVPYSVDSEHFRLRSEITNGPGRRRFLTETGWPDTSRIILYIGQLSWVKGPDIALEVFRRYAAEDSLARLIILGNGKMMRVLRDRVTAVGCDDRVFFAGFCPSKSTPRFYSASDVVLFTSRYETWARSVNEAMLCCRPCILNVRIAAAGGLVKHNQNGFVVPGETPDDYVDALRRFFTMDPVMRYMIGSEAQKAALAFSYEASLSNLLDSIRFTAGLFPGRKSK